MMAEKTSKLEIMFKRNRAFDLDQRHYQTGVQSSQRNTESIANSGNKQLDSPRPPKYAPIQIFETTKGFVICQKGSSYILKGKHWLWNSTVTALGRGCVSVRIPPVVLAGESPELEDWLLLQMTLTSKAESRVLSCPPYHFPCFVPSRNRAGEVAIHCIWV